MNKTFVFLICAMPIVCFVGGIYTGYYGHPYEACSREHVGGDNVGECVWLKLNMRK